MDKRDKSQKEKDEKRELNESLKREKKKNPLDDTRNLIYLTDKDNLEL